MLPKLKNTDSANDRIYHNELREECGVFGVYSKEKIDTFSIAQFGMFALQHRGQEACGVSVLVDNQLHTLKLNGLVLDAFKSISNIDSYQGNAAIGHTRYSTSGDHSRRNIQPLYVLKEDGLEYFSIVHNGNLVGYKELRAKLIAEGFQFWASSDTEIILRLVQKYADLPAEEAVRTVMSQISGAYSVLLLTHNKLVAFRDPHGIRPLCIGKIDEDVYVFSSETCGLDAVGATFVRDVEPGEIVIADEYGLHSYQSLQSSPKAMCSFEYIYFARPDSVMHTQSIYKIRYESGKLLYHQLPVKADLVIGVPDSGVPAALGYSHASGIPYQPILVKNRYMSRSFIVPTQEMRERVVNLKLNPIGSEIKGKSVVVLDDSIVRGTTSRRLVSILKEAGATEVHFRSASPPVIAPCHLGIDTPNKEDLIAANLTVSELKDYLEVDTLDFLSVENLKQLLDQDQHCFGCFTSFYPVELPNEIKHDYSTMDLC